MIGAMRVRRLPAVLLTSMAMAGAGAADESLYAPATCPPTSLLAATSTAGDDASLLACHAPFFAIEEGARPYNRIGTPKVVNREGKERVVVDTGDPAVFAEIRRDRVGTKDLLHLVYRIHFTKLAFKPSVFYERHANAGLLAILTLDAATAKPLLFTTVYTCGCYRALLPTDLLPPDALPAHWPPSVVKVFGKKLPAFVTHPEPGRTRVFVHLDSKTHRVSGIELISEGAVEGAIPLPIRPLDDLRHPRSIFHQHGARKGHVRGAWSPIEGLTAGLLLLDPMLGMDKDLGDPAVTGTRFYTGLLPWQREVSRLDRFEPLLAWLGFRVGSF